MADVAADLGVESAHGGPAEPEAQEPPPASKPDREYKLVGLSHIRLHPLNLRRELRDLDELADSIRQNGLLEPVVLVPDPELDSDDEGRYLLVAGHRRHAACVKAKHDPVETIIRRDLPDDGAQVLAMLTENGPRDDLTPIEEAHGYQLALDLNHLTPAKLAKRLGKARDRITSRIALTRLPQDVQERVHTHQLNLTDADALVEFADDARVIKSLLESVGTNNFQYRVAGERRRRERETQMAALRRQLEAAGAHVIDPPRNFPFNSTEKPVHHLVDPRAEPGPDGKPIAFTPEAHAATCPWHAVFINPYDIQPVYVCRDPLGSGHRSVQEPVQTTTSTAPAGAPGPADGSEAAEAERIRQAEERLRQAEEEQRRLAEAQAAEAARREALEVAARLRRDFVTTLVRRSGKAHVQAVLRLLLTENFEAWLEDVEIEDAQQLAELIDAKLPDLTVDRDDLWDDVAAALRTALDTRRSPDALAGALLAIVTHDREQALAKGFGWQVPSCRRYMEFLIAQGYELTDHERELLEADG